MVAKAKQEAEKRAIEARHVVKERLADAHRLVMEAFKASEDFTQERVQAIKEYKLSEELHKKKLAFCQGAFDSVY